MSGVVEHTFCEVILVIYCTRLKNMKYILNKNINEHSHIPKDIRM